MRPFTKRSAIIIGFTIALILLVNIAWWIFYARTAASFEDQLNRRLSSLASLGAASIDPDLVYRLIEDDLFAYDSTLEIMEKIQAADSLSEVFILDIQYRFLATTSLETDSAYYLAALNKKYIDSVFVMVPYEDRWDSPAKPSGPVVSDGYRVGDIILKSSFAPIFDTSGVVLAVLGIEADVDYTDVLLTLKRNLYISGGISIGAGLLFGLFFFLVQRRIQAAEQSLFVSQAQANLGRMVAVVSHEIKNPLMIIRASAERLMKKLNESTEAEFIIDETDRLNTILTGYLDFASGKRKVTFERINIVDLLRKLKEQFAPRLNQDGVKLSVIEFDEEIPAIADPAAVRQILINLLLNGAEAAKAGGNGEVKLTAETSGAAVVIRVEDNGPGIEPKVIKTLFEPFYTTKTTGSGLGLFLSRRLLGEMNGEIKVDSRPGGPTIFTLVLPKA